jgi:uncharacterized protein
MERDRATTGPTLRGFAPGGFRIDEAVVASALLAPDWSLPWSPPPLDALGVEALAPVLEVPALEFVLLGTGPRLVRPPAALVGVLDARGIGLEAMDSRAAARAWGVLRGEGRTIAAALYPL